MQDGQRALARKDISPALKWIQAGDEDELKAAFLATLTVRRMGKEARDLADRYFLETLVRLHRASEGEGFTGIKEGEPLDPVLREADDALRSGDLAPVSTELTTETEGQLKQLFSTVLAKKENAEKSVEAGREYVAAYVAYVHFVERLHTLSAGTESHGSAPNSDTHEK